VLRLLDARDAARRARDFALADDLMLQLREIGVAYADDKAREWYPHVPGSAGRRQGDWDCPGCGAMVYASKGSCFKCGEQRPADGGGQPMARNQGNWETSLGGGNRAPGRDYNDRAPRDFDRVTPPTLTPTPCTLNLNTSPPRNHCTFQTLNLKPKQAPRGNDWGSQGQGDPRGGAREMRGGEVHPTHSLSPSLSSSLSLSPPLSLPLSLFLSLSLSLSHTHTHARS